MAKIAIAALSFNAPSETFIRNHVQQIAPGQTVLLCNDYTGAQQFGCPVLSLIEPWSPPQTLVERVANAIRHRWRKHVRPGLTPANRSRVATFLKQHNVTALLAEYGPTGCLLMNVCRELEVPLFVHFHGYDASMLLRWKHQVRHYRKLFHIATGIIAPSQFLATKLLEIGCPPEKMHLSPCGVDPHIFRPSVRKFGHILAVGRLVEKKAPHLTIEAFAQIADKFPGSRLDIVGDGPLKQQCLELISRLALSQRITLHGALSSHRVAEMMQEAYLFVQHSVTATSGDTEGLGVSLLEAMASCVPVIATRHNGFVETVSDGETGFLVDEYDVSGMAAAMALLLDDPDRAAALGAAGRARVLEHFTIEHTRDRLRAIMELDPVAPAPVQAV